MKIQLTGATGFLGTIIKKHLKDKFEIITIGRVNSDIIYDFTNVTNTFISSDLFIHCAGIAHLTKRNNNEDLFYNFNYNGTSLMLKSLEKSNAIPKKLVFISSVSVYGLSAGNLINESNELKSNDNYGVSKIHAEKLISEWCKENEVVCTILRLPLVIGPNPKGTLFSMIKSIQNGYYFNINGGKARKSMVLAVDVANILVDVAEIGGTYNLTDGHHPNFYELSSLISKQLGHKNRILSIPYFIAFVLAIIGDILGNVSPINSQKLKKITSNLTFDDTKARQVFNWKPKSVLEYFKIE